MVLVQFLVPFGVKQQELGEQLPNLVIVFEAFKRSHNLVALLHSTEAAKQQWGAGKFI